jgi:hypothetical protein
MSKSILLYNKMKNIICIFFILIGIVYWNNADCGFVITLKSDSSVLGASYGGWYPSSSIIADLDTVAVINTLTFTPVIVDAQGTGTDVPPGAPPGTVVINIPPGNGQSGYFKASFTLPANFTNISLNGSANTDDYGRVFINNFPLSPSARGSDPDRITENGDATFSTANNTYFHAGTNNFILSDINAGGGPSGAAFYVIITYDTICNYHLPAPKAGSNSPLCEGNTLQLQASDIGLQALYQWSGPNGFASNLQNPSVTNVSSAASGQYKVSATVNGCTSNTGTTFIIINPLPLDIGEKPSLKSIDSGLVAYYPFNANANDESGNGHNTTVNGATLTADKCGNPNSAYNFYGNTTNIQIQNSSNLNLSSTKFALTGWLNFTQNNNDNMIIAKHICGYANGYFLNVNSNRLCFFVNNDPRLCTSKTYKDGKWHFIAGLFDGIAQYLYVDDTLQGKQNRNYTSFNNSNVYIGNDVNSCNPFIGKLDEIRMYNRTLTTSEIQALFNIVCPLSVSVAPDTICQSSSANISLKNSQSGVSYQLLLNNDLFGNPQTGNGNTLIFNTGSLSSTASFQISATDISTGCHRVLDTTLTITVIQSHITPDINSNSPLCSGSTLNLTTFSISNATSYQWSKNGILIPNATGTQFSILNTQYSDAGTYTFIANINGCASNPASINVIVNSSVNISFITPGKIKCSRDSVLFKIITNCTDVACNVSNSYQWEFKGNNITDATKSSYIISIITPVDTGRYFCHVSNVCGDISVFTTLSINSPPFIPDTTLNLTACKGDSVRFIINPTGTNLSYQWTKNDNIIPGATSNNYQLSTINYNDSGTFSCIVSNTCRTTSALVATLNVKNCTSISGKITYDNIAKSSVTNTVVYSEESQSHKLDSATTDNTGTYKFFGVPNGTYNLVGGKTAMKWGGCNPVDALTVNKYYVGIIKAFGRDNVLRKSAANVNKDAYINPLDALMINRRFLNFIKHFDIPDWVYESQTVTVTDISVLQDIKVICAGDVNGSYPK